MKSTYRAIGIALLAMSSIAQAEVPDSGDNWTSWTFDQNDFTKPFGKVTNFGWGTEMKPYIQLGCFVVTPKKTFIGPGTLEVDVTYGLEAFVWVPNVNQRPTAGIAGPTVTYVDGSGQTQVAAPVAGLEAADASNWTYFSSDGAQGAVYRVWTDNLKTKQILSHDIQGNARDVAVSICNVMDRVELSINKIKIKFTKN